MNAGDLFHLTKDPVWPWSMRWGLPALLVVALIVVGLTIWTYRGVPRALPRRVVGLITLRLLVLVIACLMLLRPSLASRDDQHLPSTLFLLLDKSESMTIQDEVGGVARWDYMQRVLHDVEPNLQKLHDERNVTVVKGVFDADVSDWTPETRPDGKRTDFGVALQNLLNEHGRDRNPRGLLIFSDGADNGTRVQAIPEASRWRSLPCQIHTFGLGKTTTSDRQRDLAFTSIAPTPSPVATKSKLTVRATLDAPGFENATANVRLVLDGKEVKSQEVKLGKTTGNEIKLVADVPTERPADGEIKVTLKVDPLPGEITTLNNEISTYVAVNQEGIRVLLIDQPRYPEPQRMTDALSADPRIRVYTVWLRRDKPSADVDLLQLDKQHYDVIILGDVSAGQLKSDDLTKIAAMVREKKTGLLMMGGYKSFGNDDWGQTPIRDLLPVDINKRQTVTDDGQIQGEIGLERTRDGKAHFVLRLDDDSDRDEALWAKLPKFNGMTEMGQEKPGASVLAVRAGTNDPILATQVVGTGRVVAFACDTTWRWERLGLPKTQEGIAAHARFWRRMVLWLAHQENASGNVWANLDNRRMAAGSKLGFEVGLRGKEGRQVKESHFDVKVIDPKGVEIPVPTAQENNKERGHFWKTDLPGEYRLVVKGRGTDADGQAVQESEAVSRFLVYQDDAELVRRAADHDFLRKLANAGGGKFHKPEELNRFLQDLVSAPLPQGKQKMEIWPDWRRSSLSPFRVALLMIFATIICLEWFLRRYWGMV